MLTKKQLGQRIKAIRKSKKITQEKLAEALEMDFGYISKLEVGQNFPSLQTLNKIADIFQVNISEFFMYTNLQDIDICQEIACKLKKLPAEKQIYVYKFIKSIE